MTRRFTRMMVVILVVVALLTAALFALLRLPVFGTDPAGTRLERIRQSPHYQDNAFQNREETSVESKESNVLKLLGGYWNRSPENEPKQPLPSVRTDLNALPDAQPTFVWFGHSSYLLRHNGFTLLMDPVFGGNASPVSFFGKSFPGSDAYGPADMPDIDVLVLSHDHYDHFDYTTIKALIPKVKQFVVALGVGAHLEHWGVPANRITELDWFETTTVQDGIQLTATPARHFSGRSLARGRTLWASYVLQLPGYRLFLGGDSGYDKTFAQLGAQYGPFDLAILECGQYNELWPSIHMFPEEVVQAGQDLNAKAILPVHWGKFALAYHAWTEPVERFTKRAQAAGMPFATPQIGQPVVLGQPLPQTAWWRTVGTDTAQ